MHRRWSACHSRNLQASGRSWIMTVTNTLSLVIVNTNHQNQSQQQLCRWTRVGRSVLLKVSSFTCSRREPAKMLLLSPNQSRVKELTATTPTRKPKRSYQPATSDLDLWHQGQCMLNDCHAIQSFMLIAQAVFLLECGHIDRQTYSCRYH